MHPALALLALAAAVGCSASRGASSGDMTADGGRPVASTGGFTQPEAVRYDRGQDVYFVSNWGTGASDAMDNNGFISRMTPDGTIERLRFISGGLGGATLHAPRGMTIVGDTLWVVDADAVRGFSRRTGAPLATVDFSAFTRGFLNDVAAGPDGLYVTDTGTNHIYRIAGGRVTVALHDTTLGRPNGITWDAERRRFIVVPFGGASAIREWTPGSASSREIGRSGGARFDGVEVLVGGRVIVASQRDSSLHMFRGETGVAIIRAGGRPADIAVDTKRNRVALPFVGRNIVEIWRLPVR